MQESPNYVRPYCSYLFFLQQRTSHMNQEFLRGIRGIAQQLHPKCVSFAAPFLDGSILPSLFTDPDDTSGTQRRPPRSRRSPWQIVLRQVWPNTGLAQGRPNYAQAVLSIWNHIVLCRTCSIGCCCFLRQVLRKAR